MNPRTLALALTLVVAPPALAQAPSTPPPASSGAASTTSPAVPSTPRSPATKAERIAKAKQCSAEADRQGLHGKARQKFRNQCRRS